MPVIIIRRCGSNVKGIRHGKRTAGLAVHGKALEEKRAIYEEAVTQARARATATTRGYDMRVSGSRDPHARMDAIAAASELIVRLFEQQITAKKEIFEFIYSSLEDSRARAFMVRYYINGLTIAQSAQKVGVCKKHGFRLHNAALAEMLSAAFAATHGNSMSKPPSMSRQTT